MRISSFAKGRPAAVFAAAIAVSLLSGCAKMGRDHIEVGSIPDDYRTRHPIMISENQRMLAVPTGAGVRALSFAEKEVIGGFIGDFANRGNGAIHVSVAEGAPNAGAAHDTARQILELAGASGLGANAVLSSYPLPEGHPLPPVVVSYAALTASAGPCGKWGEDTLATPDNKNYGNFGCAYQNNLAAQVANPMDLLHPRRTGPIDAANRDKKIQDYRLMNSRWSESIDY